VSDAESGGGHAMDDKVLSKELIVAAEIYRLTDIAKEEQLCDHFEGSRCPVRPRDGFRGMEAT
jgi:hypothetical protein